MNNLITFLQDIYVDGNIETNGVSKSLNTNVWSDSGTESEMIVSIRGTIHSSENQFIITDYDQLLGVPIKVKKNAGINTSTSLRININGLGAKDCKRYKKEANGLSDIFDPFSLKAGQIIEIVWGGESFIVLNAIANDFTDDEKEKLLVIEDNANNYAHPASHSVDMIEGLSDVATSGSYDDLINTPAIPIIPDNATPERDGLMSADDKVKLDNLDNQFEAVTSAIEQKVDQVSQSLDTQMLSVNTL